MEFILVPLFLNLLLGFPPPCDPENPAMAMAFIGGFQKDKNAVLAVNCLGRSVSC